MIERLALALLSVGKELVEFTKIDGNVSCRLQHRTDETKFGKREIILREYLERERDYFVK